jgi:16S rRNA (uracil1498-N3)-methyltransferase
MGISLGDSMEMGIKKSVELGVNEITPIITEHCNVVIKADKVLQKIQHWQKIAQHAAEQCGRTYVPKIHAIHSLSDWLATLCSSALKILLDPYSSMRLTELNNPKAGVILVIGPEGGFSESERQSVMTEYGVIPICLGQRILRTETASLAALAAVQLLWGDF